MRERMRPPPKADSSPHPPALAQIIGKALGLHAAYVTLAPGFIRSYDARTQLRRCRMKRSCLPLVFTVLISLRLHAQLDRLVIPAGTPEDQALQAISNEQDAQKKLAMYEDFLQKFAANPTAVAYGNWQISQYQQGAGNLQKALDYGDKALTGSPRNLDILVSQANIAQLMKNNGKIVDYSARGGEAYHALDKQTKPEGLSDQDFALRLEDEKNSQKVIQVAKADADDADRSRKLSAGVAHSTLGYVYMKQNKTVASIPELKAASSLLKGQDDQAYALAMFRLGYAYAKLNKVTEARDVLNEASRISGPAQQPAKELLVKVNAARAKGR